MMNTTKRFALAFGLATSLSIVGVAPSHAFSFNPIKIAKSAVKTAGKVAGGAVKVAGKVVEGGAKGVAKGATAVANTGLKGVSAVGDIAKKGTEKVLETGNKIPGVNVFTKVATIGYLAAAYKTKCNDSYCVNKGPRVFIPGQIGSSKSALTAQPAPKVFKQTGHPVVASTQAAPKVFIQTGRSVAIAPVKVHTVALPATARQIPAINLAKPPALAHR